MKEGATVKRGQVYFYLVCLVLVQGLLLAIANISQFYEDVFPAFSPARWHLVQGTFVAGSIVYAFIMMHNLVRAASQEAEIRAQAAQMANIADLLQAVRAQRHDFVNHVQALYGLIKIGNSEGALRYVEAVYGEVKQSSHILQLGEPEIIALLQAKTGEAEARGIRLAVRVDPLFRTIPVAPPDLNRIIGNLVDNALDAAAAMPEEGRWVELDLTAERHCFQVRVANAGEIREAARSQLFRPGFSTKTAGGHQGLGLYAVHTLAGRYGGLAAVKSASGKTVFTVTFAAPDSTTRGKAP